MALPLDDIGPVDPGITDFDEHIARTRLRHRDLLCAQHIRPAGLGKGHCGHFRRNGLGHCRITPLNNFRIAAASGQRVPLL